MQDFSKETGDFASLSKVDQQVIALGVRIARDKDEEGLVKRKPNPLEEFKPSQF